MILLNILRERPLDPAALREWGAWWLGQPRDPAALARAIDLLGQSARGSKPDPSAAILLAILTGDARLLDTSSIPRTGPVAARVRMARAILRRGSGAE